MSNSSSSDLKNFLPKLTYSPENKVDPQFATRNLTLTKIETRTQNQGQLAVAVGNSEPGTLNNN